MRKSEVDLAKLTPEQMRVKIAKDVIGQIKAKYFTVVRGQYVILDTPLSDEEMEKPLGELAKKNQCSVCALGAMFMTSVKKDKKYLANQVLDDEDDNEDEIIELGRHTLTNRLSSYFTHDQMNMIENCFEGRIIGGGNYSHEPLAGAYRRTYSDPDKALIAICENIVRNNGTFIPAQDIQA